MTKKIEPVVVHRMYTGHHAAAVKKQIFAKCLCGAVLDGQEAIDEHRLLVNGPGDNESVGMPPKPSEPHPTAKAG